MQGWYSIGVQRIDGAIKGRKCVAAELQDMANDLGTSSGAEELSGALCRVVEIIQQAKKAGWKFTAPNDAAKFLGRSATDICRDLNRAFARGDAKAIGQILGYLAAAIDGLREKNLILFAVRAPEKPKPADPVKVEVVSLPPRATTSKIERDEFGNIIRTTQVETNA